MVVHRPTQPFAHEVGSQEILDPEAGHYELFEAPELSAQEGRRLTGDEAATLLQQGEDAAGGELPHRPGGLWADDSDVG